MACDEKIHEDLVALIQHELPAEREAEVQQHLLGCPACREEFDGFRNVFKATKRINMIEPSAAFRKNLEKRIGEAIEHSKRSKLAKRPGSTGVRLPAQAPAPEVPAAASKARLPSVEPMAARVSARLGEGRRAERRTPRLRYVAFAAAFILLSLTIAHLTVYPMLGGGNGADPAKALQIAAEKRWNQRREAQNWEKILSENRVALPDELAAGENLYLVPHRVASFKEECVYAYTQADVERLTTEARTTRDRDLVDRMLARAIKVPVDAGKLALPPALVGSHLGGTGNRLMVLKLDGRLEIWSASAFERYRNAAPVLETVPNPESAPAPDSGLPNETSTRTPATPAA